MKLQIRPRLDIVVVEKKIKTATNFAERMTEAGYKLSTSQAARYLNDSPPPAMTVAFIEAACNVLQCLPSDLFDITITTEPGETLDPLLAIPQSAKRLTAKATKEVTAEAVAGAPAKAAKAKLPWQDKYGVAGPKVTPLPAPTPKE